MVAFSTVLDTLGFARFKGRRRTPAASDDATLSASRCTPVPPQTDEPSDSVTEAADFERAKITTPDGPWVRRWPRLARQPDEAHAASLATLVATQAQTWDAGADAGALTISAVLLDASIPPDARKHFRRGLHLLAIAADDTEAASPTSEVPIRFQPFTSPGRDRYTRPSIARWLLDYGPDGGVHRHLARAGALLFDIADPGDEVLFRPSGTPSHVPVHLARFRCAAVEPRVRRLVVLSRQFPWEVVVRARAEDGYVCFGDVLSRMREVAREEMRGPEFRFALQTPGGRRRLGHVWAPDAEPPRRVDWLGGHTILGSLRMDVENAMLREFTPPQWLPGTERTLYLVAEFVSPADVRDILEAQS